MCIRGILSDPISQPADALRQAAAKTAVVANSLVAGMFEKLELHIYRLQLTSVLPTGNRAAVLRSLGGQDAD